ncbi:maltose alpha-D-glucosyltransferase [uncultured Piscinibacter sp.]|uniref:maltose alpha-D-glucosyltransferase n=1 Tax=uncultured Piscinibacter sp. TaxID=1131835 RepID=UPI00262C844D|nr:maltose alpha-D-glucosyltransferase [uncultured Piscinibacter sp.]
MKAEPAIEAAALRSAISQGDPHWYKDAVIYELHVKAYADANGDGIGDLAGLTQRLDHVQSLGVNTIWLLPFYPSPLRDDGYDVADYEGVHPAYGTLDDFRAFVDEAHRRGLRVITELVVNHTSDQHPWFQAARRAPKGSPERDFYVWSDDPKKYAGTRIIFTDTEKSNWTWDEVAQQYFWHRFFSHQPDLNFDNPAVIEAVLKTMEFWLDMGVDGFRLDAIPYLIERDGTSNENLRETHDVIKLIRKRIDAKYPGRLLLAEANMWPEDVREYFGEDDECHMAYHFPLMPRMYMAIAQEDRHPVVEILAQTPEIPAHCQWAIFLRNHDELTLEMVTSKERDYLYKMYAADTRARINLGIRRRLAPLLENDRARIELMNSLLLSMPGTPVLYYGDEIGMGDNIFLGDRDGVRTPMQWTSDRNGGFSRADPQRLYLPPIQDPIYGFEALNVEAQSRELSSLLNWTRRLLAVRSTSAAFGRGRFTMLHPGNRKVLAYVREHEEDVILCVANVSRTAQPVELELRAYKGRVPVEMMGRNAFPPIGDLPYLLTLPAHGFFWFRLSSDAQPPSWHVETLPLEDLPTLVLFDGWNSFFRHRVVPWRMGLAEKIRHQFEAELLPHFMQRQRWYAAKADKLARAGILEHGELVADGRSWLLAVVEARTAADPVRYFVPLTMAFEDREEERMRALSALAVTKIRQQAEVGIIADAMADESFCHALVAAIGEGRTVRTEGGSLRFVPGSTFAQVVGDALDQPAPLRRLTASSNSISLIGERLFLKAYRCLHPGTNPELEMGRFLTDKAGFEHCVPVAGSLEWVSDKGDTWTLALLQAQVPNQGDAWAATVDRLERWLETSGTDGEEPARTLAAMAEGLRVLARRVAELHLALARSTGDPAFDPEPMTPADITRWCAAVQRECRATLDQLGQRGEPWPEALGGLVAQVIAAAPALLSRIEQAGHAPPTHPKTRVHGDLHLGQVLVCRDDFLLIDFEGEPKRDFEERRAKQSALRDVAGVLRSFDYARHTALQQTAKTATEMERLAPLARDWERTVRQAFLETYAEVAVAGGLFADAAAFARSQPLLDLFELEKALYELRYEIDNRPDWIGVPLAGVAMLAGLTA